MQEHGCHMTYFTVTVTPVFLFKQFTLQHLGNSLYYYLIHHYVQQ